jgi:hypothetical protein
VTNARAAANAGKSKVEVVPVTLPTANDVVGRWHRHHAPIPAGFVWWCVAAVADRQIVGVAIAGRPTNRNNDDGQTVEVLRVATDGTPNACSALLAACARAAKAIGASRCITYTLDGESGSSLMGAGWVHESAGITSSWMKGTSRRTAVPREHMDVPKSRWAIHFRPIIEVAPLAPLADTDQPQLWTEGVRR